MAMQLMIGPRGGAERRRPPYFKTKKLGLLGSTESLQWAPWDDPAWTLAAHPCCRGSCKREPDWYFDMHRPELFRVAHKSWNPQYHRWLQRLQTPVFMQENWPDIPMAVRYPKERIFGEFRPYFTNHCAYMIALAMTEGVTHIGLFGCQYAGPERGTQRDSLTYWLGRFEQAGGTVVIPPRYNTLLTQELYGYESHDAQGKLIPSYQIAPVIRSSERRGSPVDLRPMNEVPLMVPPPGEKVAEERARWFDEQARSVVRRARRHAGTPSVDDSGATAAVDAAGLPHSDPHAIAQRDPALALKE